jgi:shikimate dehydrogenase
MSVSATTLVAAVVGAPITHSLSPLIHNAWIEGAGLDAIYVAIEPRDFMAFAKALSGGTVRGLNVTAPFKAAALELSDRASTRARRAGAANLLIFNSEGEIFADNTDGEGLLAAFAEQTPDFDVRGGPVVILGAGGAARGAVAAFMDTGAPAVKVVNRSANRARALAAEFGSAVTAYSLDDVGEALADANAVINATPATPSVHLEAAPRSAVIMDMVYRPLTTPLLSHAEALGMSTVDGLAMLIGQARPSFTALFGVPPPDVDVRALVLRFLGEAR